MAVIDGHIRWDLIRISKQDEMIKINKQGMSLLRHVLGRALESQRTKGDCREAMKTIFVIVICGCSAGAFELLCQCNAPDRLCRICVCL
jgi:hypothetical protein